MTEDGHPVAHESFALKRVPFADRFQTTLERLDKPVEAIVSRNGR